MALPGCRLKQSLQTAVDDHVERLNDQQQAVAAAQAAYNEVSEEAKALQAKLHARSSLLGKIKVAEGNIKAIDKLMQEQDVRHRLSL